MKKILIFGAGSLGTYLGVKLQAANNDVTLYGRKKVTELDDLTLLGDVPFETPNTTSDLSSLSGQVFDYVFLTTKLYDSQAAVAEIIDHNIQGGRYTAIQNGLVEDEMDFYKDIIKTGKPFSTLTVFNGYNLADGKIAISESTVGWATGNSINEKVVVDVLRKAGIPIITSNNFAALKVEKFLLNASINAISAVNDKTIGEVLKDSELYEQLLETIAEGYRVVEDDYDMPPQATVVKNILRVLRRVSSHYTSMHQDVSSGRKTEIEFMNGLVCRMGKNKGIPTPINCALHKKVLELSKANKK